MSENDPVDISALSLEEKLEHKLWKARLQGYEELQKLATNGQLQQLEPYWKNPALFQKFIVDSNVVAQEHALIALLSIVDLFASKTQAAHAQELLSSWIPPIVEKGCPSARPVTKTKSIECIKKLCSLDNSIQTSLELILPFSRMKLPRLVASSLSTINELISSFGFINIDLQTILPSILEPLPKLASHADKNVRAQTMSLIVTIYNNTGRSKDLLQNLLLDQLKPIQQRDLDKLFDKPEDRNNAGRQLFQWQMAAQAEQENTTGAVDKDGDTLMDFDGISSAQYNNMSSHSALQLDSFLMLPEETILDKLPEEFENRLTSEKWKDRVEVLQQLHDETLSKVKRLKASTDYTQIITSLSHVISRDANVQAVTLASQAIQTIFNKLRPPALTKNYISLVVVPLLERTKERKPSVIEQIRETLKTIMKYYNPISTTNEDMLHDILKYMKHKTPQIRMESVQLFNHLLKEQYNDQFPRILEKYLDDELVPILTKVVNDTQPVIRNAGFESYAILLKILGASQSLTNALEKFDNLKRKKIQELQNKLPDVAVTKDSLPRTSLSSHNNPEPSNSNIHSTIPSKRGPSSPLKKSNNKSASPSNSRVSLTSRLALPKARPRNTDTNDNSFQRELETRIGNLEDEKKKWVSERESMTTELKRLQNEKSKLVTENKQLTIELNKCKRDLQEYQQDLSLKETKILQLNKRIKLLEENTQARTVSSASSNASSNFGVRSLSSRGSETFIDDNKPLNVPDKTNQDDNHKPFGTRPTHSRTLSNSSEDLPRRVDSLQLDSSVANDTFTNEESWKRAAEVTSILKARIEKMRAKTRSSNM